MLVDGFMERSSPEDAIGKLSTWLGAMAEALNKIQDLESGVKNPVDKQDTFRYSIEGD